MLYPLSYEGRGWRKGKRKALSLQPVARLSVD